MSSQKLNYCFLLTFLHIQNVSIGVVGKGMDFTIYDDGGVESFLAGLDKEDRRGGRPLPPDVEEELKVDLVLCLSFYRHTDRWWLIFCIVN